MNTAHKTKMLYFNPDEAAQVEASEKIEPHVFVCNDGEITDYRLSGSMTVGRPIPGEVPDIPIDNPHVSHRHGIFKVSEGGSFYISEETTNGVTKGGTELWPGGHVFLHDGDELVIPAAEAGSGTDILLVYVETAGRYAIWQGLKRSSERKEESADHAK